MALPSSGQISLSQVAVELGRASNATTSLGESAVRSLAGVPSGAISLDNLHGKSASFTATISSNQQQLNLRTWALANGWNGSSAASITVGSGVYIWSDNTSIPALTVDGSWPGGISLINNGYIIGKGGTGSETITTNTNLQPGLPGGPAMSLGVSLSITSSAGYICGGGGGGGGIKTTASTPNFVIASGGGGAGGGRGGNGTDRTTLAISGGGAGGSPGSNGSAGTIVGTTSGTWGAGGGGGGRVVPGTTYSYNPNPSTFNYTSTGGGAGVAGSASIGPYVANAGTESVVGPGNSAGGIGSATVFRKGTGTNIVEVGAGGGGWGASGGAGVFSTGNYAALSGGAAGKAINLNGASITWVGGMPSTIYGAVS